MGIHQLADTVKAKKAEAITHPWDADSRVATSHMTLMRIRDTLPPERTARRTR